MKTQTLIFAPETLRKKPKRKITKVMRTIKYTLPPLLRPDLRTSVLDHVERLVQSASQAMRRASLVLMAHLLLIMRDELPLPDLFGQGNPAICVDTYWM